MYYGFCRLTDYFQIYCIILPTVFDCFLIDKYTFKKVLSYP